MKISEMIRYAKSKVNHFEQLENLQFRSDLEELDFMRSVLPYLEKINNKTNNVQ